MLHLPAGLAHLEDTIERVTSFYPDWVLKAGSAYLTGPHVPGRSVAFGEAVQGLFMSLGPLTKTFREKPALLEQVLSHQVLHDMFLEASKAQDVLDESLKKGDRLEADEKRRLLQRLNVAVANYKDLAAPLLTLSDSRVRLAYALSHRVK
jgi:hypothetical protein